MLGIKEWDNVKYLVRHGYAIASIDYRFSTEAPFPVQIQDCNTALNFILAHATNYGINPRRFVVGGGSAGGHLALLLGLARGEQNFGADPSVKPLAILDFFGPVDFNRTKADLEAINSEKGLEVFNDAVGKLLGMPVDQPSDKAELASPINYVSASQSAGVDSSWQSRMNACRSPKAGACMKRSTGWASRINSSWWMPATTGRFFRRRKLKPKLSIF